jgi:hypothetical protein
MRKKKLTVQSDQLHGAQRPQITRMVQLLKNCLQTNRC